jgi:hypothetical protein
MIGSSVFHVFFKPFEACTTPQYTPGAANFHRAACDLPPAGASGWSFASRCPFPRVRPKSKDRGIISPIFQGLEAGETFFSKAWKRTAARFG